MEHHGRGEESVELFCLPDVRPGKFDFFQDTDSLQICSASENLDELVKPGPTSFRLHEDQDENESVAHRASGRVASSQARRLRHKTRGQTTPRPLEGEFSAAGQCGRVTVVPGGAVGIEQRHSIE